MCTQSHCAAARGTSGMDARTLLLHFSSREAVQICSHPTVVHIYLAHEKKGPPSVWITNHLSPPDGPGRRLAAVAGPATRNASGWLHSLSPNTILTCRRISRGGCIAAARRGDCAGVPPIPS
jgi:hypothetical protein